MESGLSEKERIGVDGDEMKKGTPTHTKDIHGNIIKMGDICCLSKKHYPDDDYVEFEVVFEENAFRKKYEHWDTDLPKPILPVNGVLKLEIVSENEKSKYAKNRKSIQNSRKAERERAIELLKRHIDDEEIKDFLLMIGELPGYEKTN